MRSILPLLFALATGCSPAGMQACYTSGAASEARSCELEPEVVPPTYRAEGTLLLAPTPEAEPYLADWLPEAQERLYKATGLGVAIDPDLGASVVLDPPKAEEDGWYGSFRNGVLSLSVTSINALAENPSGVLLHEVMHGLGAEHVGQGEGLMSPRLSGAEPISEADLESLCAAAPCVWMRAE